MKSQSFFSGWRVRWIWSNKKKGLCYVWNDSPLPWERKWNWKQCPLKCPAWAYANLINHYLRPLLCPSWQAGGSLFTPHSQWSKITPPGAALQVRMVPTQQLGGISEYDKLLLFFFLKEKEEINSKWRWFIHNIHVRTIIEKRKMWSFGKETTFSFNGFFPVVCVVDVTLTLF